MSFHYFIEKGAKPLELPFNIMKHSYKGEEICFEAHNHTVLEVLAILEGELKVKTDNKEFLLVKDNVLVLNPY